MVDPKLVQLWKKNYQSWYILYKGAKCHPTNVSLSLYFDLKLSFAIDIVETEQIRTFNLYDYDNDYFIQIKFNNTIHVEDKDQIRLNFDHNWWTYMNRDWKLISVLNETGLGLLYEAPIEIISDWLEERGLYLN